MLTPLTILAALAPQTPSALISTEPGNPLAQLPGLSGTEVDSIQARRFSLSESGTRWAVTLVGRGLSQSSDEFLVSGTPAGLGFFQRESASLPGLNSNLLSFDAGSIGLNDAGQIFFGGALQAAAGRVQRGEVLFDSLSQSWSIVGIDGAPVQGLPGVVYGGSSRDHALTSGGGPISVTELENPGTNAAVQSLLLHGPSPSVLTQVGRTRPVFPSGASSEPLLSLYSASVSADGQHRLVLGRSLEFNPFDIHRFVMVDGVVVLEDGQIFPGLTGEVEWPLAEAKMFAGGDWATIQRTSTGDQAVIANGAVVVKRQDLVPGGVPGERFNYFNDVAMNRSGDLVYVGGTDSGRAAVVVVPAATTGAAPYLAFVGGNSANPTNGLQVDIDGDCQLDDAYFRTSWGGTVGLSDDGRIYLGGQFVSASGAARGGALFSIMAIGQGTTDCDGNGLPDDCEITKDPSLDANQNGTLDSCEAPPRNVCVTTPNSAGSGAVMGSSGSQTVTANDFVLRATSVPNTAGLFFYGQTLISAGLPAGNGLVCIGGRTFRLTVSQASGHTLSHALDLSVASGPGGQILSGSTWLFQAWFRDPLAGGAGYDFSDALEVGFY